VYHGDVIKLGETQLTVHCPSPNDATSSTIQPKPASSKNNATKKPSNAAASASASASTASYSTSKNATSTTASFTASSTAGRGKVILDRENAPIANKN
jgi:hypothetical protein